MWTLVMYKRGYVMHTCQMSSFGRTGVIPPFSTFVLPVLFGHPGLGERYKFNSIFAQNA